MPTRDAPRYTFRFCSMIEFTGVVSVTTGYVSALTTAMSALMYPNANAKPWNCPASPSTFGTWSGIIMPS